MWIITVRSYIKKKNFLYCSIWTAYSVSAVLCVLCKLFQRTMVGVGIMHNKWYDLSDTTLYEYLLIVVCSLIAFRPFDAFDKTKSLEDFGTQKGKKQMFRLFSYAYIGCALVFILLSLNTIRGLLSFTDFRSVQ